MSMDKSTRVNRSSSWGSILAQVEWENPTSFSYEVTASMAPHVAPTSSGLRASFSENLNGTSSEQIYRGGHCDGPGKRRPWNSWGKFSFSGIGASDMWHQSAVIISHSFVEYFAYILSLDRVWEPLAWPYDRDTWNVSDSAITVIMIRTWRGLRIPTLFSAPFHLESDFERREMAPFGSVVSLIRTLQDPINQLQYNRRECQQLVEHIRAFVASLKEKDYVQNLLDLQRKLSE